MSMFGLKEAEVAPLVRAVCGNDLDREAIEERLARAAWTVIAEPGDGVAGDLISRLGPSTALTSLVERWDTGRLVTALGAEVAERDLNLARDRWLPRVDSTIALAALRHGVRMGLTLLTPDDSLWPAGLNDLERHAPAALWVRGRADGRCQPWWVR